MTPVEGMREHPAMTSAAERMAERVAERVAGDPAENLLPGRPRFRVPCRRL